MDYGIKYLPDSEMIKKGIEMNVFIKSNITKKELINCVWPGKCLFPDYNSQNTSSYLSYFLNKLHNEIEFSGIWNDMNEVATFSEGELMDID